MNNPVNMEQLAAAQKANAEVMMALTRTAFTGVERLASLNLAASREFFNNVIASTQQVMTVKDAKDLTKLNAAIAQPNMDKWVEYSRSVYDLAGQMQKELASVMEAQYSSFTQKAGTAIDKATASSPVGGDVFSAAMKSMLNASTKAFDSMNSMTKQLTDIAEANMQAATNATSKAVSATAVAAKKSR